MSYNVAVVGATGAVGREMLQTLFERKFPVKNIFALASRSSVGKEVSFGDDKILKVSSVDDFNFEKADIALFSAGSDIAKKFGPKAGVKGCIVIDNSSCFRMDDKVPLIVPEVNPEAINSYKHKNIIANPNCSTMQMVLALKPLHDEYKINRVVVSTYQAVSGAGKAAMDELFSQTKDFLDEKKINSKNFTKQIAFNLIPHIDTFGADGYTKEELKMTNETKKILDEDIDVTATCVRVPVRTGHSESINIEFDNLFDLENVIRILKKAPGCKVVDDRSDGGYITPLEAEGDYTTYISRIRKDNSNVKAINMWVVSDNLLKGAALNTVQIAECLVKKL